MAFTVEDGTGIAGANSYASIADADTYFADRGTGTWTGSDAVKEGALIRATAYIDATYRFVGIIVDRTQALAWPRYEAYDREGRILSGVPAAVIGATCELALYALSKPLTTVVTGQERIKSVQAGRAGVTFQDGAADVGVRFTFVDRMLSGLTQGSVGITRQSYRGH